ncbi:MAG: hypothetical protein IK095_05925 [Oscillospiraceae bacterium]|nr:hypothetical protein [Oscillospiraceae bacterium]
MTEFTVELAGIPLRIRPVHPGLRAFLRDYLSEAEPRFTICMTEEDIDRELEQDRRSRAEEGLPPLEVSRQYLERLALYRKLAERILWEDVLLFHGSAVAVDGQAYLFTARSGTGKSTHTRLWRQLFGDRAVMINDDKPLLRVTEEGVWVCGTPWDGKHRLSTNASAPLKAICVLTRAAENHIEPLSAGDAFPMLFQQCYRPPQAESMPKILELLERLSGQVGLYRLGCNMEPEAAKISYQGMQEEEK